MMLKKYRSSSHSVFNVYIKQKLKILQPNYYYIRKLKKKLIYTKINNIREWSCFFSEKKYYCTLEYERWSR